MNEEEALQRAYDEDLQRALALSRHSAPQHAYTTGASVRRPSPPIGNGAGLGSGFATGAPAAPAAPSGQNYQECQICLSSMSDMTPVIKCISCPRFFHENCVRPICNGDDRSRVCPNCRAVWPFGCGSMVRRNGPVTEGQMMGGKRKGKRSKRTKKRSSRKKRNSKKNKGK